MLGLAGQTIWDCVLEISILFGVPFAAALTVAVCDSWERRRQRRANQLLRQKGRSERQGD